MTNLSYDLYIDTGGTFTDCMARDSEGRWYRRKVMSHSALRGYIQTWLDDRTFIIQQNWELTSDIIRGYQFRLLNYSHEVIYVQSFDIKSNILRLTKELPYRLQGKALRFEITSNEEAPVLGARLISGTPLDLDLPPITLKLGSTKGTNALLERKGAAVVLFVTAGFKHILEIGNQQRPDIFAREVIKRKMLYKYVIEVHERIDARGKVVVPLTIDSIQEKIIRLRKKGLNNAAICLMNAYVNPFHEQELASILRRSGFDDISVSSDLSSLIKYFPRAETAIVNAYLNPVMRNYLVSVRSVLNKELVHVMTSSGGLVRSEGFMAKDGLLSGPAGGVVGAAALGKSSGYSKLISFDMGGTSTDVSRYDGEYDYQYELTIGDAQIFSPVLAIETVAAGGGSICYFDGYKLCVGPQSAGADPGPASYGAGGPLTLTDVNLLLGRLDVDQFGIPVFPGEAERKLKDLLITIGSGKRPKPDKETVLTGFLHIANERMAGAIKRISVSKGYDPSDYILLAFGGAGGLHACSIASLLNMKRILVPADAGLLSSYGLANAIIERFAERQVLQPFKEIKDQLPVWYNELEREAIEAVRNEGVKGEIVVRMRIISVRFEGQDSSLDLAYSDNIDMLDFYRYKYEIIYGHWIENRQIEVESIRVVANEIQQEEQKETPSMKKYIPIPSHHISAYVEERWKTVPVFIRKDLNPGATISGFAILLDKYSTTVVDSEWKLELDQYKTAILSKIQEDSIKKTKGKTSTLNLEAELELFTNRFMFIAENMGAMLQRTSLSVNIKERLDFSCALIDREGRLVANAPHIPVHLGSLGICVRHLRDHITLDTGDTVITNHPAYGGSHLPDITMVTPVYTKENVLLGYVVNRAHHAEIGGTRPASMPPDATRLIEEGVVIEPTHLVRSGIIYWSKIRSILEHGPYPSRSVEENIADLNAALAANLYGLDALRQLADQFGIKTILKYMDELRAYANDKMMLILRKIPDGVYQAEEFLDDGTPLRVCVIIDNGKCLIDFTGSGGLHRGNMNATTAIVNSVVIYVLRLLLNEPIPLNEGIMEPVKLVIPEGLLNPEFDPDPAKCPAFVGGNVEVSQRLTDTLLKAFGIMACSQGTMNNVLIGNDRYSYYETICGGCGAGPGYKGADAVHHHMTNTRITDPEIIEKRYPLRINRFEIRRGSGGRGQFRGGNGVIREMQFLEPASISILSQHRKEKPYGIKGAMPGKRGQQWIETAGGEKLTISGMYSAEVKTGDRLVIKTPGGGGWGER